MKTITICMGSSCFNCGNSTNTQMIQQFIAEKNLDVAFEVKGCLCEGECKNGPNIRIDGKLFSNVTSEKLLPLLQTELLNKS